MSDGESLHAGIARSCRSGRAPIDGRAPEGGLTNESCTVTDGRRLCRALGRDFPLHQCHRAQRKWRTRRPRRRLRPAIVHAETGVMVLALHRRANLRRGDVRANARASPPSARAFTTPCRTMSAARAHLLGVPCDPRLRHDPAGGNSRMLPRLDGLLRAGRCRGRQVPLPIVFGHNDLLPANFLDDGERLWLIDFEYAGFNTAMFDLAGLASNAGFDPKTDDACSPLFRPHADAALIQSLSRHEVRLASARSHVEHGLGNPPRAPASTTSPTPTKTSTASTPPGRLSAHYGRRT